MARLHRNPPGLPDGWYIADTDTLWSEPTIAVRWWPVDAFGSSSDMADLYRLHPEAELEDPGFRGVYRVRITGSPADRFRDVVVRLRHEGKTETARIDYSPAPRPPARGKELRWYRGRWQRLYTKRGWVDT